MTPASEGKTYCPGPISGAPGSLQPMHILWINFVTDGPHPRLRSRRRGRGMQ